MLRGVIPKDKCSDVGWQFSCLVIREYPMPALETSGATSVLVQIHASGVNPSDLSCFAGAGCLDQPLLHEFSGTVVRAGDSVDRIRVGDSVWGMSFQGGTLAQYAVVDSAMAGLRPTSLSAVEAATMPESGLTSLACLKAAGVLPRAARPLKLAITSGTGGTGFYAVQVRAEPYLTLSCLT